MTGTAEKHPLRIGIYGGTFDPPHNGHLRAAESFLCAAELDVLYIMPASIPPHKRIDTGSDPQLRLALAHAAFDGMDPRIQVSDYEVLRDGVSYTYKTLSHFAETTDAELFFLCGTDMFLSMDTWRFPEKIFALSTVACVMREDDPAQYRAVAEADASYKIRYRARTLMIPHVPLELSSSEIRQILKEGGEVSGLVPDAVAQMIRLRNLYRGDRT